MRNRILPALLFTTVIVLSACSGSGSTGSDSSPTVTATKTATATKTKTVTQSPDDSDSKPSKSKKPSKPDKHRAKTSKLTLTVHGKKKTIKPTRVYCKGSRGHIHHIVGKTGHRPPIVKAEGKHFAMVKPGRRVPYKAKRPSGLSYGKDRVKFAKTSLGPATLSGTMICTKWED